MRKPEGNLLLDRPVLMLSAQAPPCGIFSISSGVPVERNCWSFSRLAPGAEFAPCARTGPLKASSAAAARAAPCFVLVIVVSSLVIQALEFTIDPVRLGIQFLQLAPIQVFLSEPKLPFEINLIKLRANC